MRFAAIVQCWGLRFDESDDDHADAHADATDDEQELAAVAIDCPDCVQCEDDTKGGIEGIDQCNGGGRGEDFLVDLGAVGIQGALTGDLLSTVDHKGEQKALAYRAVFPESGVGGGDFFLEF